MKRKPTIEPKKGPRRREAGTSMTIERQIAFWIAALFALVVVLWLLSPVLLPFVAGIVLAYLLNPLARRLERLGIHRAAAGLVIIVLALAALIVIVLLLAPILVSQLSAFIDKLPGYVMQLQTLIADPSHAWLAKILGERLPDAGKSVGDLVTQGAGWIASFLRSLWSGGQALVTPVVAFYLLCDWDRMIAAIDNWVPRPQRETVRALAREIDAAIAGFVRGQSSICLILSAYYAVSLALTGLNFGFLIGFVAGVLSFIPYVGSLTGLVVAIGVAIAQFWPNWMVIVAILAIFLVGQLLEGYVLAPRLVGRRIGLHPVWLMFALFAFGYLFGFVGLLVAVPLAAAIGVLVRFALRQYLASPLYRGGETS
jgi:predicted PurR-regulated permease PerM